MTRRSETLGTAAMVITALCALAVTALLIKREMFPQVARTASDPWSVEFKPVPEWEALKTSGHLMGKADAPITIVEFSDFECPFCAKFTNRTLTYVKQAYGDKVAIVFHHWPLENHRFAYPAARASECAAAQGSFEAFHNLVFAKQDSLGLKPFSAFAADAGVVDAKAFEACNTSTAPVPIIEKGIADVKSLGGRGTPTVAMNGYLLPSVPDSARLDRFIQDALKNRDDSWTKPSKD